MLSTLDSSRLVSTPRRTVFLLAAASSLAVLTIALEHFSSIIIINNKVCRSSVQRVDSASVTSPPYPTSAKPVFTRRPPATATATSAILWTEVHRITRNQVSTFAINIIENPLRESGLLDQTSVASYSTQQDVRSANISSSNTPQSDYGVNPSSARSQGFPPEQLARYSQQYHAAPHHQSAVGSMAQSTSPSMSLQDAPPPDHRNSNHMKSDSDVPIDPSIAQQSSPNYPPPYSPYNPQGHDMAQYQGHPPPGMYQPRPDGWGQQYGHHMPGPYQSPATTVGTASPNTTAGPRPGQVCHPQNDLFSSASCHTAPYGVAQLTRQSRSTPSFQSRVPSSTSDLDADTKRLSECTSVVGRDVKRRMAHSTISTRT